MALLLLVFNNQKENINYIQFVFVLFNIIWLKIVNEEKKKRKNLLGLYKTERKRNKIKEL